jgi:hypothetical protein
LVVGQEKQVVRGDKLVVGGKEVVVRGDWLEKITSAEVFILFHWFAG